MHSPFLETLWQCISSSKSNCVCIFRGSGSKLLMHLQFAGRLECFLLRTIPCMINVCFKRGDLLSWPVRFSLTDKMHCRVQKELHPSFLLLDSNEKSLRYPRGRAGKGPESPGGLGTPEQWSREAASLSQNFPLSLSVLNLEHTVGQVMKLLHLLKPLYGEC